jgi:hypothetical protein
MVSPYRFVLIGLRVIVGAPIGAADPIRGRINGFSPGARSDVA